MSQVICPKTCNLKHVIFKEPCHCPCSNRRSNDHQPSRHTLQHLTTPHPPPVSPIPTKRTTRPRTQIKKTPPQPQRNKPTNHQPNHQTTPQTTKRRTRQRTPINLEPPTKQKPPLTNHHLAHPKKIQPNNTPTPKTTQKLLPPIPSRPTQPNLAIRLHPRTTKKRYRHRSNHLARRPLPLPPTRKRTPPHHLPNRSPNLHPNRQNPRPTSLNPHRQRNGLHHPTSKRKQHPQQPTQRLRTTTRRTKHHPKKRSTSTPTTQGKIERYHQTLKKWLNAQPPATNLTDLNTLLKDFQHTYNTKRPHRALNRKTPHQAYHNKPKAHPTITINKNDWRVRLDTVDQSGTITLRYHGKLTHLGIGRAHKNNPVIALIHGPHTIIINKNTGEIIAEHTINPNKTYQPKNGQMS